MAADPQGRDPKTLWRDQEPEADPVTLDQIHDLVRKHDHRARFTQPIMVLGVLGAGFIAGQMWLGAHDTLQRATAILFPAGELGCYLLICRTLFPSRDPAEPISAYLRRRMVMRLSFLQGGLIVVALPLAPFLLAGGYEVMSGWRRPLWVKLTPFAMAAVVIIAMAVTARLGARRLSQQLRELDELMKR